MCISKGRRRLTGFEVLFGLPQTEVFFIAAGRKINLRKKFQELRKKIFPRVNWP